METSAPDVVTEDNDGEIPANTYEWTVDLSHMLSQQLGRQMPMMATYRVKYIQLSLRNVNDAFDNDLALQFGGVCRWYTPTAHRIDALQMARTFKRARAQSQDADSDPFHMYTNDAHYKGLRWNWNEDGQVAGEISDDTNILAGSYFSFDQMFEHYDLASAGRVVDSPYPTSGEGQALWNSRTGRGDYDSVYFTTSYKNRIRTNDLLDDGEWFDPESDDFELNLANNHLPVLGGLLRIVGVHTNTDGPGVVDDNYYVQCTVGVEGWSEF